MAFGASDLLTRIRLRARLSSSDADYTDAVLLDLADQCLIDYMMPIILTSNADYFLTLYDQSITSGRNNYPIPTRSYQNKVHSIYHLNSDKTEKGYIEYGDYRDLDIGLSGTPVKHTIENDEIKLFATPSVTGEYLRIKYYYTPSALVAATACMAITGGESTGVLTGDAPAGWGETLSYDIVSGTSPFALLYSDLTALDYEAGVQITFSTSTIDSNRLAAGTYYVTLAGQTCFPMIPQEMHYTLAHLVAVQVLEDIGDEGAGAIFSKAMDALNRQARTLAKRKHSENKPWVRRYSPLRCRV